MDNMMLFLSEKQKFLSHVNFSNMNFDKDNLIKLATQLKNSCIYLIGIHLSNNNITQDKDYYYEVLEIFNLGEEDVVEINRSMIHTYLQNDPNKVKKYESMDIDYGKYLDKHFTMNPQTI